MGGRAGGDGWDAKLQSLIGTQDDWGPCDAPQATLACVNDYMPARMHTRQDVWAFMMHKEYSSTPAAAVSPLLDLVEVRACVRACVRVCVCACACVCVCVHAYMCVHACICVHTCASTDMCVYIVMGWFDGLGIGDGTPDASTAVDGRRAGA